MELTQAQTNHIKRLVKTAGIKDPALFVDICDHFCCVVEEELDQTNNFYGAIKNTKIKFGSLTELQKETSESKESVGTSAKFIKFAEGLIFAAYLGLALIFILAPVVLSILHQDLNFLLFFSPFVAGGLFICVYRVNYRQLRLRTFKENIFPDALVQ